jgi:hypothetical protein
MKSNLPLAEDEIRHLFHRRVDVANQRQTIDQALEPPPNQPPDAGAEELAEQIQDQHEHGQEERNHRAAPQPGNVDIAFVVAQSRLRQRGAGVGFHLLVDEGGNPFAGI